MNQHLGAAAAAYVRGELHEALRLRVQAHLEVCAECRSMVQQIRLAENALSAWPADPQLPESLTQALIARARNPVSRGWPALSRIAALVALVLLSGAAGYGLGRTQGIAGTAPVTDSLSSFLLLMEEERWPPASTATTRTGYGDWANAIRRTGQFVGGEKLTDEPGWRVHGDGSVSRPEQSQQPQNVSGWFLVRARDYDAAVEWARRGPHLRYGTVLVRQVE